MKLNLFIFTVLFVVQKLGIIYFIERDLNILSNLLQKHFQVQKEKKDIFLTWILNNTVSNLLHLHFQVQREKIIYF